MNVGQSAKRFRRVGVVCAVEAELTHLRDALAPVTMMARDGRHYERTGVGPLAVVLVRCGIGMVNAAAATEALLIHYHPDAVLNYGCTGAHREDLLPGDLVIGERVVAYDHARVAPNGQEIYRGMRVGHGDTVSALVADPDLLAAAHHAARALEGRHEPWPVASGWPSTHPHRLPRLVSGAVASADRWNQAHERIRRIVTLHESLCEDMEAAAIAIVCARHAVPFLTLKDISNNELLRASDFTTFQEQTAGQLGRRAAALTLATLRVLAGLDTTVG